MESKTEYPVPLSGTKAPTLMWAHEHEVEPAALNQLRNISSLPWVAGVRVMPDVHLGKGATVGSVIAMRDAVSPNAVGVDIGCGMSAVRTSLRLEDLPDDLHSMRLAIEASEQALQRGDMPFGATLVSPAGEVLMVEMNNQNTAADCTGHAEMVLVRIAAMRSSTDCAPGSPVEPPIEMPCVP